MSVIPKQDVHPFSVSNEVTLDFSPSDFVYYASPLRLSPENCENMALISETSCNDPSLWNDISYNCQQQSVCKNQKLATELVALKSLHQETGERTDNFLEMQQRIRIESIGIIIGMVAMIGSMYLLK